MTREEIKLLFESIEALSAEPCEDAISRADVIEEIRSYFHDEYYQRTSIQDCRDCFIEDVLTKMPSVTPKQKMGRWEWVQYDYNPKLGNWHCSECRSIAVMCVSKEEEGGIPLYEYCPYCGAKMEPHKGGE